MRQNSARKCFGERPNLSHWHASMTPVKQPLRANLAFACELRWALTGFFRYPQYQIKDLIRRTHEVTHFKQNERNMQTIRLLSF
ncbi:hypothetical protein ALQ90_200393 [Pseudomonas savastanoi pv. savastanoi]|nr:hypothetical protein ALQ90_200393 [Pseudomonas savastanoi pv. savastanoi]